MEFPKHVAIIPDGNRTRASSQGKDQMQGHIAGQENSVALMDYIFKKTPIQVATFWGLSTENLKKRPKAELDYLFKIYAMALQSVAELLTDLKVSFKRAGNRKGLPDHLLQDLDTMESDHSYIGDRTIVLCINYGGRDELLRGVAAWADAGADRQELDEKLFGKYLDFGSLPRVDLVIRTKGKVAKRLSGFMLWWVGYAELFFSDQCFPDFTPVRLEESLVWYDSIVQERNFGK